MSGFKVGDVVVYDSNNDFPTFGDAGFPRPHTGAYVVVAVRAGGILLVADLVGERSSLEAVAGSLVELVEDYAKRRLTSLCCLFGRYDFGNDDA